MNLTIANEAQLEELAYKLAKHLDCGVIYLDGALGAGKTTFIRYLLRSLGEKGKIKSPTYTLVENYKLEKFAVNHFDLYRLAEPSELEFIGIRDYDSDKSLCVFEWWEKGAGYLPKADLIIEIKILTQSERSLNFISNTTKANQWLKDLNNNVQ